MGASSEVASKNLELILEKYLGKNSPPLRTSYTFAAVPAGESVKYDLPIAGLPAGFADAKIVSMTVASNASSYQVRIYGDSADTPKYIEADSGSVSVDAQKVQYATPQDYTDEDAVDDPELAPVFHLLATNNDAAAQDITVLLRYTLFDLD